MKVISTYCVNSSIPLPATLHGIFLHVLILLTGYVFLAYSAFIAQSDAPVSAINCIVVYLLSKSNIGSVISQIVV